MENRLSPFLKILVCLCTVLLNDYGTSAQGYRDCATIGKKDSIPGMEVVHVKNGKWQVLHYGVKRTGTTSLVNDSTAFQAASLSKVITAYVFFRLYDRSLIQLDTPLYHYFAYQRLKDDPYRDKVTARTVLTHRTGLLNWEGDVGTEEWKKSPLHVQFLPGSRYSYSGEGFYYLQLVMEHITHQSFQQLVESEVFGPFDMKHSATMWRDDFDQNCAYGHDDASHPRTLRKYPYANAAYTIYTTAYDYSRFVQQALNEGKGLSPDTYRLMTGKANDVTKADTASWDDVFVPIALGMRIQNNEKGKWLWHTGSNPGFRCFFITNPKTKESLVAFFNTEQGFPAMYDLMKAFLQKKQHFYAYTWRQGELD